MKVQKKTTDLVAMSQDKLDEARERTPCTSAGVEETEQRRTPCLDKLITEKMLAENPQLAVPRKKTHAKDGKKRAPDEPEELEKNPKVVKTIDHERPRPGYPVAASPAPPPASRPPRRWRRRSRTRTWTRRLSRCS